MKGFLSCLIAFVLIGCANNSLDYSKYMNSQSLIWEEMPLQWNEAAFTGNGHVGQMAYVDTTDNSVTLWLGRTDVTDHRGAPDRKSSLGIRGANKFTDFTRLDVGKFKIFFADKILSGKVVQNICTAEVSMTLNTAGGQVLLDIFTPYNTDLHVLQIDSKPLYSCYLVPGCVLPSRMIVKPETREEYKYVCNPDPVLENDENRGYYVQPLTAGGDYAAYWEMKRKADKAIVMLSVKNGVPEDGVALGEAKSEVARAFEKGTKELKKNNRQWWNKYYSAGLIEIPDKKAENFYNIQLYKIAASSAKGGPAMDLMGPFYKTTQWPAIWWNLNVQLTYMSTLGTNRLEQCENYIELIDESFEDIVSCTKTQTCGDYTWALHLYYQYMKYAGYSVEYIYDRFRPKAELLVRMYSENFEDEDGIIILKGTESPEYEGFKVYDNSNYNLSCLRWLLQTLISLDVQNERNDERFAYWQDILARLHPYETDKNGFMIARGVPLAKSHRHYSHLLSFYPLGIQDVTDPENREMIARSVRHWIGLDNGAALAGYSYTGAVSLLSYIGDGNMAYENLHHFLNKEIGISILLPNTFYVEGKGRNPVIETPLSAATGMVDMLLQSWGGSIKIFPAIPDSWKDCAFERLRAEGGFDVSARMADGKLSWVRIYNDAGNTCRVYLPDWDVPVLANGSKGTITPCGDGYFDIEISQGAEVVISDRQKVKILPACQAERYQPCNYYGVKKGMNYNALMDWPYPQEYKYLFPKNPFGHK